MGRLGPARTRFGALLAMAVFTAGVTVAGAAVAERRAGPCDPKPGAECAGSALLLADLGRADLRGADLRGAVLNGAFLHGAALDGADLGGADLRATTLTGASLRGANLNGANLANANLELAALDSGALAGAYVCKTKLRGGGISERDCDEAAPATQVAEELRSSAAVADHAPAPDAGEDAEPLPGRGQLATTASIRRERGGRSAKGNGSGERKRRARGRKRALRVTVLGSGRVVSSKARRRGATVAPKGRIKCPKRCKTRFPTGARLVLKAKPRPGWKVEDWRRPKQCGDGARRCRVKVHRKGRRNRATVVFAPATDPDGLCIVPRELDTDSDGIGDCVEREGWDLSVTTPTSLSGVGPELRHVTSDPARADTDGDGLSDDRERQLNSDPDNRDTDEDGLDDLAEIDTYRTLPGQADSDGDSAPPGGGMNDPRLFDLGEAETLQSNPRLPDTDGDSISDYLELVRELTNPRVPDLPQVSLIAVPGRSSPRIELAYSVSETTGTEEKTATSTQDASSHTSSSEKSRKTTDAASNRESVSATCHADYPKSGGCSGTVSYTRTDTHSETEGSKSGFEDTRETTRGHEEIAATSAERNVTVKSHGCMQVPLKIENDGPVSVALGDIQVLVWVPDPEDPKSSRLLTALLPIDGQVISSECPATAPGFGPIELAPGGETFVAFAQEINKSILLDYMANPASLTYEFGPVSLTGKNVNGEEVDFHGEVANRVKNRTANIEVDYGNGNLHSFSVAPTGRYRADGRLEGVTLGDALGPELGDLDAAYDTLNPGDPERISALRDPESGDLITNSPELGQGAWSVFSDAEGGGNPDLDWRDIVLRPGNTVVLAYVRDQDEDKVIDGKEHQLGTDPDEPDTDGDGLTDYQEAIEGWTVPFTRGGQESYKVFSSPLSCDADGDGSPDGDGEGTKLHGKCPDGLGPESERLTDPTLADTNLDGRLDGDQELPEALRSIPQGGRMPLLVRTWGGEGTFGSAKPAGLAVDPNQALFNSEGRPAPIDSYVVARTFGDQDDQVWKFTGNPRNGPPDLTPLRIEPDASSFSGVLDSGLDAGATGIAVAEGSVGSGNDAGPPVIVNYYPKNFGHHGDIVPGDGTNALTVFNGLTGDDMAQPGNGNWGAGATATYGGFEGSEFFGFPSPVLAHFNNHLTLGNGFLDIADRFSVVVGHGVGYHRDDLAEALPTRYADYTAHCCTANVTTTYGERPEPFFDHDEPLADGVIVDPSGVAIDRKRERLYVADQDSDGNRLPAGPSEYASITRFDLVTGEAEEVIRSGNEFGPLTWPRGLAIGPEGEYIYAVTRGAPDPETGRGGCGTLVKLSAELGILGTMEIPGADDPDNCSGPEDVEVDRAGGVWISDPASKLLRFYFFPFGA